MYNFNSGCKIILNPDVALLCGNMCGRYIFPFTALTNHQGTIKVLFLNKSHLTVWYLILKHRFGDHSIMLSWLDSWKALFSIFCLLAMRVTCCIYWFTHICIEGCILSHVRQLSYRQIVSNPDNHNVHSCCCLDAYKVPESVFLYR